MHRMLFLAYYYPPENESGSARPSRLRKYLERLGTSVHVVARRQTPDGDKARYIGSEPADVPQGSYQGLANLFQRYVLPNNDRLPWVPHAIAAGASVIQRNAITVLFSTSPPLATHLAALELRRRYCLPWIADFRDPLYDNSTRSGSRALFFDAVIERTIFNAADLVIANTEDMAEIWRRRYPKHVSKIVVLYNGYDPEEDVRPSPIPDSIRRVLTHTGHVYDGRDPSILLSAVHRLIQNGRLDPKRVLIRLIGTLETRYLAQPELLDRLRSINCLEWGGPTVPKAVADEAAATSDYLLLMDNNRHERSVQVPAKLFTYLRLGRFILALSPENSPSMRIIRQSGVPYACMDSQVSEEEADRMILELWNRSNEPVQPSPWFHRQFNGAFQAEMVHSLVTRITSKGTRVATAPARSSVSLSRW